jgi:hypothetical protein
MFAPLRDYDEPQILQSSSYLICLEGADPGQRPFEIDAEETSDAGLGLRRQDDIG